MKQRRYYWLAAAIVLLAFFLRAYRFAELPPGLFFDEAFNALDGLAVFRDGYHPVFFEGNNGREAFFIYMQSVLIRLAGASPFVIRYSAVIVGTLTVALTYPLVLRLLRNEAEDRRQMVALLSTFLLATLQWHLNFSRVGFRAIAQPFFEALAVYLLYRAAQSGRRGWILYVLSGLALGAGAYTYLSARLLPIAIAVLIIAGVVWGQRLTKRYIGGVLLAALVAMAVVAPLAFFYWQHPATFIGHSKDVSLLNFGGWRAMLENEVRLLGMFNWAGDVNWRHNLAGRPVFDPVIGVFFLAGVALTARRLFKSLRSREGMNGYLAPAVMLPVMLLPSLLSEGAPHYLRGIGVLPFVTLLPAVGIEAIWRRLRAVSAPARMAGALLLAVLAFNTGATYKAYFGDWGSSDQPYHHFDGVFIDFANYVKSLDPGVRVYVTPWIADHATAKLLLRDRPYKSFDSKRTLVLTNHTAVFAFHENGVDLDAAAAFPKQMPAPLDVDHLRDRYGKAAFDFFRISGRTAAKASLADMVSEIGQVRPAIDGAALQFGEQLALNGYILSSGTAGTTQIEASAGAPLPLALVWQASHRAQDDYTLSVRLIDGQGRRRMQSDGLLGGRSFPTSSWDEDELVFDKPEMVLPPDLPPGDYRVELAVYSLTRKAGLEVKASGRSLGELAKLTMVHVAAPSPDALAALNPPMSVNARFGAELTLLGYGLDRDTIKAGEIVDVELFWKAERDLGRDVDLKVELMDKSGTTASASMGPPLDGSYPSSRWRAGDGFRDAHRLAAAARAAPGGTTVRLAVLDRASGQMLGSVDFAGPVIADRPHVFEAPKPQLPLQAKLGDKVELLGLNSDGMAAGATGLSAKAGGTMPVTLIWRSASEMQVSYTVFVQLLNAGGQLVAQHDGLPQEGGALTSSWLQGEIVADRHVVPLRANLPPGQYTLIAGLYNAADGKRLPAGDGDFLKLGTVALSAP